MPNQRFVFVAIAISIFSGCSRSAEVISAKPERKPVVSDIHPAQIRDAARFLAGLPGREGGAYQALEATESWKTYSANFNETWAKVEDTQLKPVAEFEKNVLAGAREASRFVFYPFSGPDVLYMTRFFPGRDVYVMAGLEPVGRMPMPGEYTAESAPFHLTAWSTAMNSIFRRSFFVTSEMSRQLHSQGSYGTLPLLTLMLTRIGYTVDGIQFGKLSVDGKWEKPGNGRVRLVRIDFHQGDADEQTLYYFSTDLRLVFGENTPMEKFLDGIGRPETFLKSASFLPHLVEFTKIRNYMVRASTRIVQDDTGVPYKTLVDQSWKVRLFGEYSRPDPPFRSRYQQELADAFADTGRVEPLGFAIGYGFHRRPSSLIVATPGK